jgi:reductive dehalogenase
MRKQTSFDDIYLINPTYKRFNQQNTAFNLARKKGIDIEYDNKKDRIQRISSKLPGYSLLDYAFRDAADTGAHPNARSQGYYSWTPLGVAKKPIELQRWDGSPEKASRIIRKTAKYYGAVKVGFSKIDKRWIYTQHTDGKKIAFEDVNKTYVTETKTVIPNSHQWVIALTVPMELNELKYAPTALQPQYNLGYSRMHALTGSVAEFIRGLGYNAIPCGNDTAISVPIAIQAGLGHAGRNGRLITWERGLMVRISKIFTDLPLAQSEIASNGLIEFCEVCTKCAENCPSGAIPHGPRSDNGESKSNNNGVHKWYCDPEQCLKFWQSVGTNCGICFRVCPFSRPNTPLNRIIKWFIRELPSLNRLWVWTDELFGHGKMADPTNYWD